MRPTLKASLALAFFVAGCAAQPGPQAAADATAFAPYLLPGAGEARVQALQRPERTAPLRYRVIVLPGSGCAGMGSLADRYFAGLLHAEVLVLHKPGVAPGARTAASACAADFVQADRLSAWRGHARAALRADARERHESGLPAVPQVLVGISEGAELLPSLAPEVPHLAGLVLLSASGLDPREAGALQAQRLGVAADWETLGRLQAGSLPDSTVAQGRSLGYWRDLWHWPLAQPLREGPWPVLQVWGGADALVPADAFRRGARQAQGRQAPWCVRELPGADHGLQAPGGDGVQQLWAWLEQWARDPQQGLCAPLQR
ncbi:MAG: alpha/beta hydrolase [Pseudomonadota bacterium]